MGVPLGPGIHLYSLALTFCPYGMVAGSTAPKILPQAGSQCVRTSVPLHASRVTM